MPVGGIPVWMRGRDVRCVLEKFSDIEQPAISYPAIEINTKILYKLFILHLLLYTHFAWDA